MGGHGTTIGGVLVDSGKFPWAEHKERFPMLSFGIKGGLEAGAKFIDALQLAVRLVNIGDAKTLACHPATTTHRQLSPDELARAGVSKDLVRMSIGIEHIDDIIADLDQALATA